MPLVHEGSRRFLKISLTYEWIDAMGWFAFMRVQRLLREYMVSVEELEHRYTEENYMGLVAVFEVVHTPSPDALNGWMYEMEGASDV